MGCLYYVRHGQTVWNVENKICGSTDSPLTELGHQQAISLAEDIVRKELQIDEILFSPLSRAADTAKHIAELTKVSARMEPRLVEQCFGKWESTPRNGEAFKLDKMNFVQSYETGETMLRLCQRVYNLLDEIVAQPDRVYLLVAHNGIARAVHSYFNDMTNEEFSTFGIKNCEIIRYDF